MNKDTYIYRQHIHMYTHHVLLPQRHRQRRQRPPPLTPPTPITTPLLLRRTHRLGIHPQPRPPIFFSKPFHARLQVVHTRLPGAQGRAGEADEGEAPPVLPQVHFFLDDLRGGRAAAVEGVKGGEGAAGVEAEGRVGEIYLCGVNVGGLLLIVVVVVVVCLLACCSAPA